MSLWMKLMMVSLVAIPMVAQVQSPAAGVAPAQPTAQKPATDPCEAMRKKLDDWPQLGRYADANATLPGTEPGRVVFYGDSITDAWTRNGGTFFPGKPYVNRGISGQTTEQMVVRFRQDVIDLHPAVLVVLAGTNDLAGVTGSARNEDIEANYASIAELARLHQIRVVFASLLPVNNYTDDAKESFALRPRERILALNTWLRDYCAKNRLVYLDYFSAMVDSKGMLKRELSDEGLHPNAAGYKIMAPLAEKSIAQAIASGP